MVVKGEVNTKNIDYEDMKKHKETDVLLSKGKGDAKKGCVEF